MLASGPSGFYNAPVSKALFIVTGVASLAFSVLALNTSSKKATGFSQTLARFIAFSNSSEILFSSLLIYSLRLLERQFGSNKYSSLLLTCAVISSMLSALSTSLFGVKSASGPYGLIFGALTVYSTIVPVTVRVRILGIGISDKVVLYLLAAQLLWSQFPRSLPQVVAGIIAGILWVSDELPFKSLRVPQAVVGFCKRVFMPVLASRGPTAVGLVNSTSSNTGGGGISGTARVAQEYSNAQQELDVVISEESVGTLVAMGFERESVIHALRTNGGSVERAAAALCG
ncbi:hypothetical protein BDR26DRAFT_1010028 [Obelidium mucronatum]|nr:hypothetical protein BDR26DRAFT_1010028 [Obelidium mucronatum]